MDISFIQHALEHDAFDYRVVYYDDCCYSVDSVIRYLLGMDCDTDDLSREFIEAAFEDGAFLYGMCMTFYCPDCVGIGDEQYCCTTCWCNPDTEFRVHDAIDTLLNQ